MLLSKTKANYQKHNLIYAGLEVAGDTLHKSKDQIIWMLLQIINAKKNANPK